MWKLRNTVLNNEEFRKKFKTYKINILREMKKKYIIKLRGCKKPILRWMFIVINAYVKKKISI